MEILYTFQFQLLLTNEEVRLQGKINLPELCQYGLRMNYCFSQGHLVTCPNHSQKAAEQHLELKCSGPQALQPLS